VVSNCAPFVYCTCCIIFTVPSDVGVGHVAELVHHRREGLDQLRGVGLQGLRTNAIEWIYR